MRRCILQECLIILAETALLFLFAATWGIPGDDRPRAAAEAAAPSAVSLSDQCRLLRFFPSGPVLGMDEEPETEPCPSAPLSWLLRDRSSQDRSATGGIDGPID